MKMTINQRLHTHIKHSTPAITPIKVLLIEDNPGDARLIQELLKEARTARFDVTNVERLHTGLRLLREERFDVLLLDLNLPDSQGSDTLAHVQNYVLYVPIVLLTSLDDEDFALETVREGAQDYLVKSQLDKNLLTRTLKYAIERKQAEQTIRRRNRELALLNEDRQRLSTALEQTAESVIITDAENVIVYANPAFEQVTGYTRSEIIGLRLDFLQGAAQENSEFQELQSTINKGQVWQGRLTCWKKDGTPYTSEVTTTPIRDENGSIINYVSVQRDVTRELQLEEQYRHAQKMEAVGKLAAGIAHDFNNLLTIINGFSALLQAELSETDSSSQESVERIIHAGQRAAELVKNLLAFSREQAISPEAVNLNTILNDMNKMLHSVIGENIELKLNLDPNLWITKTDPAQFEQVIINLAVNARDAMPDGGRLTIETKNVVLGKSSNCLEAIPGKYIELAVSDTGIGMSEEVKASIFEPFYTTKEVGKGTGLGLATVFGIIKQSEGHIQVFSELDLGTTFKVYLPCIAETLSPKQNLPPIENLSTGSSETILFVEDDDEMRALIRWILQRQDYTLLEAQNGQEALQISSYHPGPIDLLLTDVVMPGMSGQALAKQLAQTQSNLKILYMSGYNGNAVNQFDVLDKQRSFLRKPFSPIDLTKKVRYLLDG